MKRLILIAIALVACASVGMADSLNIYTVGTCSLSVNPPDFISDCAVNGNYAYVANESAGLRIIDISALNNPIEVGHWNPTGIKVYGITVKGNYAYVAAKDSGLTILNISNPANPIKISNINTPGPAFKVKVQNGYAFVADHASGLRIIDVSDTLNPTEVGFIDTPSQQDFDVFVVDTLVYLADIQHGLHIISIRDAANPYEVGHYQTSGSCASVFVTSSYAYITDGDGLSIIDITTPSSPTLVGSYTTSSGVRDIFIKNNFAYLADYGSGLRVLDITTTSSPLELGYYTGSFAQSVTVDGEYMFLVSGNAVPSQRFMIFKGYNALGIQTPTLLSPSNNAYLNTINPHFVWNKVDSAAYYVLQVAGDSLFANVRNSYYSSNGNDTTYNGWFFSDSLFYWRVKTHTAIDSSGWSLVWRFRIDTHAPLAPSNITANGNNPSPWNKNNSFAINLTDPADSSGIARYLYKAGMPAGQNDTSGTAKAKPFAAQAASPGTHMLYVWCQDSAGNANYLNYGTVGLQYDPYPPYGVVASSPAVSTDSVFGVDWASHAGADSGGSGLAGTYWVKYKVNGGAWQDLDTNYSGTSRAFTGASLNRYFFAVSARDHAGNVQTFTGMPQCSTYVNTGMDLVPPRLHTITADTAHVWSGIGFTMHVYAADDKKMGSVSLAYARAGDITGGTVVTMNHTGDSTYVYDITAAGTTNGCQYRVTATDSAGNSTVYPSATSFFIHRAYYVNTVGYVPYDQWQMVSFPCDLTGQTFATQLGDDLGNIDNTKWRLFRYLGSAYGEVTNLGDGFVFGQAYWLKQRIANPLPLDFNNVPTYTPGTSDSTATIGLQNGWNDFGLPYQFDVNWADIKQATGADTVLLLSAYPYTYSGSSWVFPVSTPLSPWKGYSIKTTSGAALRIRPAAASKGDATKQQQCWPDGWVAKVSVASQNGMDECNYFGIGAGTSQSVDRYDYPEPPSFFSGVYGCFALANNTGEYGSDIRPALGDGQTWDFAVKAPSGATTLIVNLPANIPAGASCVLCDGIDLRAVGVNGTVTYQYRPEPGEQQRQFRLIVGSDGYVRTEISRAIAVPAMTLLQQNRPNPFSTNTVLGYQLAAAGKVELTVYDIAGRHVRSLVAAIQQPGRYRVDWDGRNSDGAPLASGVYFVHLKAGGISVSQRLVLLK